jgi:hypothetical protein
MASMGDVKMEQQIELGNLFFGHSRGEFHIDRDKYQNLFCKFLRKMGFDNYGCKEGYDNWEFDNDVFHVQPYYWGECKCGFEEIAHKWEEENEHKSNCYYLAANEIWMAAHDLWQANHPVQSDFNAEEYRVFFEKERMVKLKELCETYSIPWDDGNGCLAHCTCGHDKKWQEWRSVNDHKPDCKIVTPNFVYKPTGFEIRWYKYALRDSYANREFTKKELLQMMEHCKKSICS